MAARKRIIVLLVVSLLILLIAMLGFAMWKGLQKNQDYRGTFVRVTGKCTSGKEKWLNTGGNEWIYT